MFAAYSACIVKVKVQGFVVIVLRLCKGLQ